MLKPNPPVLLHPGFQGAVGQRRLTKEPLNYPVRACRVWSPSGLDPKSVSAPPWINRGSSSSEALQQSSQLYPTTTNAPKLRTLSATHSARKQRIVCSSCREHFNIVGRCAPRDHASSKGTVRKGPSRQIEIEISRPAPLILKNFRLLFVRPRLSFEQCCWQIGLTHHLSAARETISFTIPRREISRAI